MSGYCLVWCVCVCSGCFIFPLLIGSTRVSIFFSYSFVRESLFCSIRIRKRFECISLRVWYEIRRSRIKLHFTDLPRTFSRTPSPFWAMVETNRFWPFERLATMNLGYSRFGNAHQNRDTLNYNYLFFFRFDI